MQPLDDFFYFAKVVEFGGYARASRALAIPKSRLSRHITALETRLGVRLVNRSSRRLALTDTGRKVYVHALAMLAEAEAAVEAVERARSSPRGVVRVACPVALAQSTLAPRLPVFLERYPGADLATGRLERVLPEWHLPQGTCHVVFASRRGLLPAVRAFIDFLAVELSAAIAGQAPDSTPGA